MSTMQPGPTLYEAERLRKQKGTRGLLGEIGEPMSYAPGPVGLLGNALLGAQYLTGEKPLDEGLSALAMMTGLLQGTKVAPIMRNAIKVYHGSPHKFDKPDSSKIGTGEGAQSYGHGLYWAENPSVAKEYAVSAQPVKEAYVREYPKKSGKFIAGLRRRGENKFEDVGTFKSEAEGWSAVNDIRKGNTYEANLRWPDPAREAADPLSAKHFLDWDKPLSEQPKSVQKLLKMADKKATRLELQTGPSYHTTTGGEAYSALSMLTPDFNDGGMGRVQASEMLRRKGIPGITYLDAGSRAAGQGTRNYVTFDDALVELLKRNGGLLGAGK